MADINVERKGPSIWPWIIGLIILALLIWALVELLGGEEEATAPVTEPVVTEVQPTVPPVNTPEPIAQAEGVPVSQIIESPATWTGQTVGGEVRVTEVPTDRGFWIEDQGERLFAVIIDAPEEQPKDINPGQTLRLEEAVIRDRTFLPEIPGVPLDPDTERIAEEQEVFLTVAEENINILGQNAGAM